MKPQILPTSIEYGNLLREKVEKGDLSKTDYFKLRTVFDDKIMHPPTIADFIPSVYENVKWRVLEEPTLESIKKMPLTSEGWDGKYWRLKDQYQTALNNVKFSGWGICGRQKELVCIYNNELDLHLSLNSDKTLEFKKSYSDLTPLNLPLTERGMEEFNINI
mgnify:CR=1 FL=1